MARIPGQSLSILILLVAVNMGWPSDARAGYEGSITVGQDRSLLKSGPSVDYNMVSSSTNFEVHEHAGLTPIGTLSLDSYTADSQVYTAGWTDEITVTGNAGVSTPSQVLLKYAVDGGLHLDLSTNPTYAEAGVSISSYDHATRYAGLDLTYGYFGNGVHLGRMDVTGNLNHLTTYENSPTDYGVTGYVNEIVDLNRFGTASTQVYLSTGALHGISDFQGTLTLSAVTLADGSPLPQGVHYSFDSGLVPTAVPEPSSLVLAGIACLVLGLAWVRRPVPH